MTDLLRFALAASMALNLALAVGCDEEEPPGSVLSGSCEAGVHHCVDRSTIQYCPDATWTDPEECPPDNAGSPEIPVLIQTYCSDDHGCQPG
jgi:hypothetical protein